MARRQTELEIVNPLGLHARAAAKLVGLANKFESVEVWIGKDGQEVNGKSILGVLMLGFLNTGCTMAGLSSYVQPIFIGATIVIAAAIDRFRHLGR